MPQYALLFQSLPGLFITVIIQNVCLECGKVLSRASDVPRHMRCHDTAKFVSSMYLIIVINVMTRIYRRLPCPLDGCNFKTLQKSNLETHIRTQCVLFAFDLFSLLIPPLSALKKNLSVRMIRIAALNAVILLPCFGTESGFIITSPRLSTSLPKPLPAMNLR